VQLAVDSYGVDDENNIKGALNLSFQ